MNVGVGQEASGVLVGHRQVVPEPEHLQVASDLRRRRDLGGTAVAARLPDAREQPPDSDHDVRLRVDRPAAVLVVPPDRPHPGNRLRRGDRHEATVRRRHVHDLDRLAVRGVPWDAHVPGDRRDDHERVDPVVVRVPLDLVGQLSERPGDLHLDRDSADEEVEPVRCVENELSLVREPSGVEGVLQRVLQRHLVRCPVPLIPQVGGQGTLGPNLLLVVLEQGWALETLGSAHAAGFTM